MIDDLKYIHQKDGQDALGVAEKQWQQLAHSYTVSWQGAHASKIENIVFAGMGGSALAALLSTTWPAYDMPFEIVRTYDIPAYVGPNTLFIASSYSGNTEETLSALDQAGQKDAQIAIISSGGALLERAEKRGYPVATLPTGLQPRYATLYNYKALATILDAAGITQNAAETLESQAEFLQHAVEQWRPDVPSKQNIAKQIALDVVGKSPVVYAGPLLFPAAYKWKISFNENAKNIAWCNQLPEFNHNEFLGWSSHPVDKPYAVIDLRSSLDHPQVQKRFDITAKLLSGKRPQPITVEAEGKDILEQLLWTVVLGDFVSLYTALLNGLNPTPVDLIEKLKKELA